MGYDVDRDGNLYLNGEKKRQVLSSHGYPIYFIDRKLKYVHRLVAEKYIPNTENKPQVNHINGIKTDNRVCNLEWVSAKENFNHAIQNNLWGENILKKRKMTNGQVIEIRNKYSCGKYTHKKLASEYGVDYKTIYNIVNKISYKEI